VRGEAAEVVDPGDARPPGVGDHHLAGDGGRAACKGDGDGGRLLGTQGLGGPDGEGRVLRRALESRGLEEDVFEGDGGGAAGLDGEGALGLGREGSAEEGDAVLPPEQGGEPQHGPGFTQLAGLVGHVQAHFRAPRAGGGRGNALLCLEVSAVGLRRGEKGPRGGREGVSHQQAPAIALAGVPFPRLVLHPSHPHHTPGERPWGLPRCAQQVQPRTQTPRDPAARPSRALRWTSRHRGPCKSSSNEGSRDHLQAQTSRLGTSPALVGRAPGSCGHTGCARPSSRGRIPQPRELRPPRPAGSQQRAQGRLGSPGEGTRSSAGHNSRFWW